MFNIEQSLLKRIKDTLLFQPVPAPVGPTIHRACVSTCTGSCNNRCTGGCKGSCHGSCTRSCKGHSR